MTRLFAAASAIVLLAAGLPASAQTAAAPPDQKGEAGTRVLDNAPATPADVREALRRYQNVRSAVVEDGLPDGSMLVSARLGNTSEVHRVKAPGADRTQITFFDEPIAATVAQPGS